MRQANPLRGLRAVIVVGQLKPPRSQTRQHLRPGASSDDLRPPIDGNHTRLSRCREGGVKWGARVETAIAVRRCKSERSSCGKVHRLMQVGIALRAVLEATRSARSADPTLYMRTDVDRRTDATQSRPYPRQSKDSTWCCPYQLQLGWGA